MPTPDPNLEQRLRAYARQSEAVGDQAAPLQPAKIRTLVAEARARRQTAAPAPPVWRWWADAFRQHWGLAATAAGVAVLLLILVWPRGDEQKGLPPVVLTTNPAHLRVVFAVGALRGDESVNDATNFFSFPLQLDLDLQKRVVHLEQTNGIIYTGTISAVETLQAVPLKQLLALSADGLTGAGKTIHLRGTLVMTFEEGAATPTLPSAHKVVVAVLEVEPTVSSRVLKEVRLEYPE